MNPSTAASRQRCMQTMLTNRNTIIVTICSLIFVMAAYLMFFKSNEKSTDLTETYMNVIDTLNNYNLDSSYVQHTISRLSSNSSFNYCGTAGYSGAKVPIINPTPLFKKFLSESQLISLCEENGSVVKHFAFEALCQVNIQSAKKLLEKQISDTSLLVYQCGCMGTAIGINLDFLNTLKSKITNMEAISYLQKIKSLSSPFLYKSGTEFFKL